MKKAKVSKYGQWKYPGQNTIIPNANGRITMKGVPYPVLGIDDMGNQQMMMPNMDYQFPGNSVYEIPMMAYGGDISIPNLRSIKIKSLPKAQVNYNPQFETSYDITKSYAENLELNKRAKEMGWNSVDEYRQSNWGQKPVTKEKITEETKEVLNTSLKDVADWEKNWYSKRAQLPQFTDVANKRLGLVDKVNTNVYNDKYWNVNYPDASGTYNAFNNAVNLPAGQASNRRLLTHERSHWYDFNAPQNPELEQHFFEWGSRNVPQYNYDDRILNNILPVEYTAFRFDDPLHRPNTKNKQYNSEIEKILDADAQWEPTNNERDIYDIQAPFETQHRHDYLYNPTEVRARLNEWRREFNIDPTRNYTEKEFQQIIDNDLNSGGYKNNDFYKIIRGKGDLLKKIHDAYVSTGGKENPDEMPRAQTTGNVKKGKTLFGRPYQVVETESGPTVSGRERPGETTRVKTVYYKNGNVAKQIIDNNEVGGNETTWHDKDGKVTAVENDMGYRTFSNGYFDYTNNSDYEASKRRQDESEWFDYGNKLDAFIKRAKLNLENISKDGSQPGDSYNTIWSDWENNKSDYTRTKNPGVRKSRGKFEYGGILRAQDGLPSDYELFLKYSETAPENRRPDADWQYGNPRQYDHYGMWDALGKPKDFEQALEINPHWQPDPYDGMYHGFSTNPNTGVWLKSHIPGESHPGDTGWMEYKDFMLSNDRNWGGKNQNLVYDPDLQRMRYVDREKAGGTIKQVKIKSLPKAQDGFLGDLAKQFNITPAPTQGIFDQVNQVINTPKQKQVTPSVIQQAQEVINKEVPQQTTPGVFEQIDKFSEDVRNIKPTSGGSSESMYNRFTKMLEAAQPEPEAPKEFTIPEDYYTRLMQEENGVNRGLRDDRYYQYPSHEKGTDTIGYGHKLTEEEQKSGRYKDGLTKDEAIALMRNDVQEHLGRTIEQYNEKFGNGAFDKLHPDLKVLALDYVYNGIPINEFPNFFGAANKYSSTQDANAKQAALNEMLKQYVRHDDKGVPLGSRNEYTKGVLMNLKQRGGLPKAQQLGQFGNWRDILDYRNAAEPKQNLVGDVRKTARPTAVAESTKVPTQKLPANWKELKEEADLSAAADARLASGLDDNYKSSYPNDPAGLPSVPVFEAALMAPVALKSMAGLLGTELLGTGVTVGNVANPAFAAQGVYNFANPNSDFRRALSAYNKGEGDWRDVAFEGGLNALNFFGAKTLPGDFKKLRDLSKSSPLLRSASSSTAGFTKPSLLTNITDANAASYEDDLFRYIADAEGGTGIDRDYLMALPEDQYRMYGELDNTLRNPNYTPTQGEIRQFLQMDSRLNNRIMPPANEMVFDNYGFREMYANPFASENVMDLTRPTTIADRLLGRLSRNFADVPLSRVRSSSSTNTGGTTNRSYMTKEETKALVKDKAELDKLDKLDDTEFRDLLITPDGRIKFPEKYTGPKEMIPMETDEWVNEFNDNLDLLNNIIAKNNTSGRDYWVTGIDRNGYLKFADANGKLEPMYTRITPGRFRGEVADVASMDYMANDIPGLIMESAQPIFGEAVRGTGTYKSLNEFLKAIDLGRIKSGMNTQSKFSKGLWEDAVKKGNAFGYYSSPGVVHGIMKKDGGAKKKKAGFQVLTDANGKYVFVKT